MEDNLDTQLAYRRLKVTNNTLFRRISKMKIVLGLSSIITVASCSCLVLVCLAYGALVLESNNLKDTVKFQNRTIDQLKTDMDSLNTDLNTAKDTISGLSDVAVNLEQENTNMKATIEELETLKQRAELYDKYEYALVRQDGSRTDVDYDYILTLEKLAEQEGLGNDAVALVLAISYNESRGYADLKNSQSSAAGLCGLLKSTAEYSYENLLNYGSFTPELVYDPLLNLEMAMSYIAYLKENTDSNYELLVAYRGDANDKSWFSNIEKHVGKSISKLDI